MRLTVAKILLALIWFVSLAPALPAHAASGRAACSWLSDSEWAEARSQSFALLYPEGQASEAVLAGLPLEYLDAEYSRLQAVFGASLNTPLTLRIYPDEQTFSCLNSSLSPLVPGTLHTRVGEREIALIAGNLLAYPAAWQASSLDILRYELGVLFAAQLSARTAPPGLLAAVGHYVQDPAVAFGSLQLSPTDWDVQQAGFRDLWESSEQALDLQGRVLAASTVAYLVDEHGWASFLEVLKSLATSGSPNASFQAVYGQDMAALQDGWQDYLPRYFRNRWQANALYNLDLSPYEELLKTEKYAEAARQLAEILPFLEGSGQVDRLRLAVRLVERARRGNEAEKAVAQGQAAFGAGDYSRAAELVATAERSYVAIGNYSRADELHAFRDQMQKILALHGELDALQNRLADGSAGVWVSLQLVELDQRLGRLGDAPGQLRARRLANQVEAGQLQLQTLAGALVVTLVLSLLGMRIWLLRRPPAPEAQL